MKRFTLLFIFAFFVVLTFAVSLMFGDAKREVVIAAAANFSEVFRALGPQFEASTGIHPIFTFASTAQLARQIEGGAPFDLYAAADREHPEELARKGLLSSPQVFARGVLALWVPSGQPGAHITLRDLADPRFRVIALAKPELAPYGQAAVEALSRAGVWDQVKPRVVFAENIVMAMQYGASGNSDAVLTAYSLVLHQVGTVERVDPQLYRPLDHALGVVLASKHQGDAKLFAEFLLHGGGRGVLRQFGYQVISR